MSVAIDLVAELDVPSVEAVLAPIWDDRPWLEAAIGLSRQPMAGAKAVHTFNGQGHNEIHSLRIPAMGVVCGEVDEWSSNLSS